MDGEEEDDQLQEEEFEVEDILRYKKSEDGSEHFLVKWQGYSEEESTWEPLAHMNDNCKELIAKARALFAWRRAGLGNNQSPAGEIVVSSAAAPSPNTAATTPEAPAAPSIAIIEEDKEDAQAGAQPGLEEAVGQEEEEEEEEEDTEAEEVQGSGAPAPPAPQAQTGDEEISIIEDDDEPPPASTQTPEPAVEKRPLDLAQGFVGAPSDPRTKRPRLIPPTVEVPTQGWDGAVPSQAKVPAPAGKPATNGVRHAPPGPTSLPITPSGDAAPRIPEPPKPPPSREIKCLCGVTEQIAPNSRPGLVVCRVCNCSLHTNCVTGALHKSVPAHFVCPPCRLDRVDEFHPTVGAGLLKHSYASSTTTFSLTFAAQASQWKKQCWAVHLRSVHIHGGDLSGPAWPHKVQGKLNGRQCVAIEPPKHLHVRREQCYNLTPLLKQGLNTLELRFFPKPDRAKDEPEENYCVGVVLTRPRSAFARHWPCQCGYAQCQEWLDLTANRLTRAALEPLNANDALIIIDMQADFVPKNPSNPHGGRFGVAEGDNVIPLIESLVDAAVTGGASICATRETLLQKGSMGSYFHPRIGAKLTQAMKQNSENVMVAFKAFHEHIDSFGAFPYFDGGDGRLTKKGSSENAFGVNMGCAKAPFTGSVILKQILGCERDLARPILSQNCGFILSLLATDELDINAPPDVLAVLDDGVDRKLRTLHDVVKDKKRIFVCGLALDFCVLDSCLNAIGAGLSEVYMVLDAARAAHIPGVGAFGSGFLSDPTEVVGKIEAAGVKVIDSATLSGVSPGQLKERLLFPEEQAFPQVLAPLGLSHAQIEFQVELNLVCTELAQSHRACTKSVWVGTFRCTLSPVPRTGKLASVSLADCTGKCSPRAKLPLNWTNAPKGAVELCWADPVVSSANAAQNLQKNFLAVSASPELCFLAYGGFFLLDSESKVVAVQAVTGDTTQASLNFEEPRKWREAFTQVLKDAGRFKPVTLPALLRQGACEFAWVNPKEDLVAGPEHWIPSETGAYVYLLSNASPVYFPVVEAAANSNLSSKLTKLIQQDLGEKDSATDKEKVTALLCKLGCEGPEVESLMQVYMQDRSEPFSISSFMAWMSVASIITRIRARSQETVSTGRARVERLIAQVASMEAGQEDECAVTGNFGRTLKPLCPVSHCPIEEAAIGRDCHHIQVFDLHSYIAVNQRMRSLDKRWTCPVCGSALRPDDVVLHPFAQGILDTLRGDEDSVEAIVFDEDCNWSTISAVKDEKRAAEGEGEEGGARAEMIDLSDSE
eukprot:s1982_g8.t1